MSGLVVYGIHTEKATYHVHFSPTSESLYVYRTADGRTATELLLLREVRVGGVVTALGWTVEVTTIPNVQVVHFPEWEGWGACRPTESTTAKGQRALRCVMDAVRQRRISGWSRPVEVTDRRRQLMGIDLVVTVNGRRRTVQIKCDYRVGETGNLFLQHAEQNAAGQH